jgi:hypothetical protein
MVARCALCPKAFGASTDTPRHQRSPCGGKRPDSSTSLAKNANSDPRHNRRPYTAAQYRPSRHRLPTPEAPRKGPVVDAVETLRALPNSSASAPPWPLRSADSEPLFPADDLGCGRGALLLPCSQAFLCTEGTKHPARDGVTSTQETWRVPKDSQRPLLHSLYSHIGVTIGRIVAM